MLRFTLQVIKRIGNTILKSWVSVANGPLAHFGDCDIIEMLKQQLLILEYAILGTIAQQKYGEYGWSLDCIFISGGKAKTMGSYPDEERCLVWNTDAYHKLAKYLNEKED